LNRTKATIKKNFKTFHATHDFFCNPLNKKGDGVNSTQGRGRQIQKARGFGQNVMQGVAAMLENNGGDDAVRSGGGWMGMR
jgi:hypothetical protein